MVQPDYQQCPDSIAGIVKKPWTPKMCQEFTTCTNLIIHLFYPPKIYIGIVFDFSWDIFMSQEKLQTMVMQKFEG